MWSKNCEALGTLCVAYIHMFYLTSFGLTSDNVATKINIDVIRHLMNINVKKIRTKGLGK